MRKNPVPVSAPPAATDDDIRDYAYHLYVQSGSVPGHDLDNWLEARACLSACIPPEQSNSRLHHHLQTSGRKVPLA